MEQSLRLSLLTAFCASLLVSCVETAGVSTSASAGATGTSSAAAQTPVPEALTKHDVALRFLTAFIRLDQNMALLYATPEAVSKLNWKMSHQGNIPYYDDKMLLQFNGGWARVVFQDIGGTYRITDFEVHRR